MTEIKINEVIEDLTAKLNRNKVETGKIITEEIDGRFFNDCYLSDVNITTCQEHKDFFVKLINIKQPVLYWFSFKDSVNRDSIRKKYEDYSIPLKKDYGNPKYRNTSALKKDYSKGEKTLYVGKVKSGFWGRIVTHLGYNKSIRTAGMQLNHWYNSSLFGNLTLNYIILDNEMANLITVLEIEVAQQLKPIIGTY